MTHKQYETHANNGLSYSVLKNTGVNHHRPASVMRSTTRAQSSFIVVMFFCTVIRIDLRQGRCE
jgi:hypothetical protein